MLMRRIRASLALLRLLTVDNITRRDTCRVATFAGEPGSLVPMKDNGHLRLPNPLRHLRSRDIRHFLRG